MLAKVKPSTQTPGKIPRPLSRGLRTAAYLFLLAVPFLSPRLTNAAQWGVSSSLLQLPAGGYHYLAFGAQAAFGDLNSPWLFQIGGTPPSTSAGYTQSIYYTSFTKQAVLMNAQVVKPFIGFGLGAFMDKVNSMNGFTPSIVGRGGLSFGSGTVGGSLFFEVHTGIYDVSQLGSYVAWPLSRVGGSIDVRL